MHRFAARIGWASEGNPVILPGVNDYERVARIIRHLDEHYTEQPNLGELAQQAGLSPFHFHRLFSKWAGVTPKAFLQCLTVAHAKRLLRQGESVLETAMASGLSGPGRLHDLCIHLEAAAPGELRSHGAGLEISYGFAKTPFGDCLVAECRRGVCHLSFIEQESSADAVRLLECEWPAARLTRDDAVAAKLSSVVFRSAGTEHQPRPLAVFVRGTSFQIRVWRALLHVPPGSLVSYGKLATALESPKAARAVGTALATNPVAFLIPCHRVIRQTGLVHNYRWGQARKRIMVAWESAVSSVAL